jgi:hypothetical protein
MVEPVASIIARLAGRSDIIRLPVPIEMAIQQLRHLLAGLRSGSVYTLEQVQPVGLVAAAD